MKGTFLKKNVHVNDKWSIINEFGSRAMILRDVDGV